MQISEASNATAWCNNAGVAQSVAVCIELQMMEFVTLQLLTKQDYSALMSGLYLFLRCE